MFIQTEHIYLRALEPTDLELLYTCENDRLVWKVSNTITPFSKYILQQYLESSQNDIYTNKQLRLMICTKNRMFFKLNEKRFYFFLLNCF